MDNEPLKKELEQLHAELEKTKTVDPDQSELLQQLVKDVKDLLARSGEIDPELNTSLNAKLTQAIELLEITHPALTARMNKLLNILSGAGI
jgi:chromosome segregation ATPase